MPSPGELLVQRYRLDARIGGGAMGDVWRATDTSLARTVAVKVVRPELLREPEFRQRFLAEARTMALIRHPGVVVVHDYHSGPDVAFLVMEYVPSKSLAQVLGESGKLPPARALELVAQAAEALQAAHDAGVIHRDVKPGNLLVTEDGRVVLTDFGIARTAASAPLTATGALIGTMSYLAPEQVQGKPATVRSDVYALGVVAYECLTGVRPFQGSNPFEVAIARLRQPVPPLPGEISPAIRAVVERALSLEPEQRWASAMEFGRAARQAARSGNATPAPGSAPTSSAAASSGSELTHGAAFASPSGPAPSPSGGSEPLPTLVAGSPASPAPAPASPALAPASPAPAPSGSAAASSAPDEPAAPSPAPDEPASPQPPAPSSPVPGSPSPAPTSPESPGAAGGAVPTQPGPPPTLAAGQPASASPAPVGSTPAAPDPGPAGAPGVPVAPASPLVPGAAAAQPPPAVPGVPTAPAWSGGAGSFGPPPAPPGAPVPQPGAPLAQQPAPPVVPQPGASVPQPGASVPQPGAPGSQPGAPVPQPGTSVPQPGAPGSQPPPGAPASPGSFPAGGYQAPSHLSYRSNQQNVFGLVALVVGILSIPTVLCCSPIGLLAGGTAIGLGVVGMRRAAAGQATNRGLALAGLICGVIGVAAAVVSGAFSILSLMSGSI